MREKHVRELMVSALTVTKPPHHPHLQKTSNFTSSPRFTTDLLDLSVEMRHPKTHSEVPHPEPVELPQGSIPRSIPDSTPTVSPSDESNFAIYRFVLPFLSFSIFVPRCICQSHPRWLRVLPSLSPLLSHLMHSAMNNSMFGGEIVMRYKRDKEVSAGSVNTYSSLSMSLEIVILGNARKRTAVLRWA